MNINPTNSVTIEDGICLFLQYEMSIDVQDLHDKLRSNEIAPNSNAIIRAIKQFIASLKKECAEEEMQKVYMDYEALHCIESVNEVLDALRHAFDSFAYGGLHQLYTRQVNEVWYPKIKLSKELKPNDIRTLDEIITIYRGCGGHEFKLGQYGQAWTTSKTIANKFAYLHYQLQPWYTEENRIVVKTRIAKNGILFSDQSIEYEVVVDTSFLGKVEKCT